MPDDRTIWSATAVKHDIYHPILKQVHQAFIDAGSTYITCNNFGITPGVGFSEQEMVQLTGMAGRLVREAVDTHDAKRHITVCGSLPPLVESYRPDKVMNHDDGVVVYKRIIESLDPYVDMFLAETLSSSEEVIMALDALHEFYSQAGSRRPKDCFVSMTVRDSDGKIRSGEDANKAVMSILNHCQQWHTQGHDHAGYMPKAVLFNCSTPESITIALRDLMKIKDILESCSVRIGCYPNRLTVIAEDWELASSSEPQAMRTDVSEQYFVDTAMEWISRYGVSLVGGCCGIGPSYLKALAERLADPSYPCKPGA